MKTVRVGVIPGQINEYAVEEGTSIQDLLELAGLSASGYEVKVDGSKVDNITSTTVTQSTNLVLLAKQVKGNSENRSVRVGVIPGQINEFIVPTGTPIADLLEIAGLSPSGYEVKVDGTKVDDIRAASVTASTNLVLLAKQVKGNK